MRTAGVLPRQANVENCNQKGYRTNVEYPIFGPNGQTP